MCDILNDSSFVESVMASTSIIEASNEDTGHRKRARSDDCEDPNYQGEEIKKMKSSSATGQGTVTPNQHGGASTASDDVKDMFTVFVKEMTQLRVDLNQRMSHFEEKVETKLIEKIETLIDAKIKQEFLCVRTEVDSKVQEFEKKVKDFQKSYLEAAKGKPVDDIATSVVIKNLPFHADEDKDSSVTERKVCALLRDGLKVHDVKVKKVERKKARSKYPGVIIATFDTLEQKDKVMKTKSTLKNSRKYSDIYVEHCTTVQQRMQNNNMRILLKEMGKDNLYTVNRSGFISKKGSRQ